MGIARPDTDAKIFSPGYALDRIAQIVEKHSLSPREYIEQNFIIKNKKQRYQKLTFNRVQDRIYEEIEELESQGKPVRIDILKPRQHGVSTVCLGIGFDKVIRTPGTHAVSIAHKDELRNEFRMTIRRFWQNLPQDERPRMQYDRKGYFYFPTLDSAYHIWTAGGKGTGAGFTIHYLHASEIAKWDVAEPEQVWADVNEAATWGAWRIRESTPKGMGWWYELWLQDNDEGAIYTPLFFPWWWADEYRLPYPIPADEITPEEKEFLAKTDGEVDLYQLAWRRAKIKEKGDLFWQDYAEDDVSCFLGLDTCVFDVAKCRKYYEKARDVKPLMTEMNNMLKIWKTPEPGKRYVAGCDVGVGDTKGDFSVVGILDWETGEAVAQIRGRLPIEEFSYKVAALCEIYNNALLAVEREPHGHYVLGVLTRKLAYPNLYYHQDYDSKRERLGWVTSHKTRPTMIEGLSAHIREGSIWVPDEKFWRECLTFVRTDRKKDGEAAAGQHDDMIFAYGIALEIRKDITGPRTVQVIDDLAPSPE